MLQIFKKTSMMVLVLMLGASPAEAASPAPKATQASSMTGQSDRYENLELFNRVLQFVETNYVDPVKNKNLIYGAIKGMMDTLDPHSAFLPPEVFKDMKIDTSGKFGGLGIEIGMKDSLLTIISPIEDTPAWKAGLKPGDRIVKINGESTKGMSLVEAVAKMRGSKGSGVTLSIYRDGFDKIKDVKVTRAEIKINDVKSQLLEPKFGYVRLTSFDEDAAKDMKKAIDKLENKSRLQGLVFDLRNNPGGLLDQAVDVASLFIDDGVVVSTIGRNRAEKDVKYAKKGMAYKDFPVAILVNSSTASAAEIVSGALQDHHRAIIMGQPTFGKGSVQTVIDLGHDLGMKLTIARYYTPSGRSIQEKGVQPDILLDDFDPKLLAQARRKFDGVRERDLQNHMVNTGDETPDDEATTSPEHHSDYTRQEVEALVSKKGKSGKSDASDDMTPVAFDPKADYQVKEALNYLKSYGVFRDLAIQQTGQGPSTASAKGAAGAAKE